MRTFYKRNPTDRVWWVDNRWQKGEILFSFDRKRVYNIYQDYEKLTPDQKAIFDRENVELVNLLFR